MLSLLLKSKESIDYLILRIFLGIVILPHGLQKLLGLFGGYGFTKTLEAFEKWFSLPKPLTVLVILAESFGALMLILGLGTRIAAFSIILVMLGAITLVTGRWGFFMNWYSEQRGEGYEFHILVIAMSLVLMLFGSGKYSIDQIIYNKFSKKNANE